MKFYELMRAFFRKMVQMCSNFATTCTIRGTRGAKLPTDVTFSGRSMVEMLGVLAIIGVLSVGAIAGYSKAMFKYKLNKALYQNQYLLHLSLEYANQLPYADNNTIFFTKLFVQLKLIPENITDRNQEIVYDALNNQNYIYSSVNARDSIIYQINWNNGNGTQAAQFCTQYTSFLREYYNHIKTLEVFYTGSDVKRFKGGATTSQTYPDMKTLNPLTDCRKELSAIILYLKH